MLESILCLDDLCPLPLFQLICSTPKNFNIKIKQHGILCRIKALKSANEHRDASATREQSTMRAGSILPKPSLDFLPLRPLQ